MTQQSDQSTEPQGDALKLVLEQAEDEGLWFAARTAPEAYLQQALRRLHSVIEGSVPSVEGKPSPGDNHAG